MSQNLATLVFILGILGLFVLDRDRGGRTSFAIWIPVIWLSIGGSRMVSQWLAMAPNAPSADQQLLEGSPLDRNILTGLTITGVAVLISRGKKVGQLIETNGPLVLFFLYCGISVLWSDYPFVAFKRWIKTIGDLIMVLIVLTEQDRLASIKQLLARLGFLLIPTSILLIKYYGEIGRGYANYTWEPVVTGVTTGKNLLGMVCFICGLGALWRLAQAVGERGDARRRGPLIAQVTLFGMVLWLFWLANSMTALLCFLLAASMLVATSFLGLARKLSTVHLMVVGALSVSASILFLGVGSSALSAVGRDPTLTGRTEVWEVALRFAGNPIVGTGFESFWLGDRLRSIWAIYWWHPNEAHDGYIEIYLTLGWVGLVLLAVVMVAGYRNILVDLQRNPVVGRLRLAFFVAVVAYNFTEAAIRGFHPLWVFFLLTVLAIPDDAMRSRVSEAGKSWALSSRKLASHFTAG